jgi:hypothetical protein
VTGRCETVTGKRRELDLFITSHHASPPGVTQPEDDSGTRNADLLWAKRPTAAKRNNC